MCGIIGYVNPLIKCEAQDQIMLGLYGQQHRGQEAHGFIVSNGLNFSPPFYPFKALGVVIKEKHLTQPVHLHGHIGIGHVRYSTQGSNTLENAPPHFAHLDNDQSVNGARIYIAQNGDITNLSHLRQKLHSHKIGVFTENDGEVLVKIVGLHYRRSRSITSSIQSAMEEVEGAFSAVLLSKDCLYAFRDAYGFRPLVMGRTENGGIIFASETVALDLCEAKLIREIKAGEIIKVDGMGDEKPVVFNLPANDKPLSQCIFELIYFSHPSSKTFGIWVDDFRKNLGKSSAELYRQRHPNIFTSDESKNEWVVSAVPDSSNAAALAFAKHLNLNFEFCLVRSHYTGRSFISPTQENRDFDVKMKFAINWRAVKGKHVILVDDSIVRGTTLKKIVAMMRVAGALSVHLVIVSPPIKFSCHMGIDTHRQSELIAAAQNEEAICSQLEVNSLQYNTLLNLTQTVISCKGKPNEFCTACFNGNYRCALGDYQKVS